jgi:hypothetical protein
MDRSQRISSSDTSFVGPQITSFPETSFLLGPSVQDEWIERLGYHASTSCLAGHWVSMGRVGDKGE